jgi:hypothetical protein
MRKLPADIVIPARLTVSAKSFEAVAKLISKPRKPTEAMRELLVGKPVRGEP